MSSWTRRHSLKHWERIKDRLPKKGYRLVVIPKGTRNHYTGMRSTKIKIVRISWATTTFTPSTPTEARVTGERDQLRVEVEGLKAKLTAMTEVFGRDGEYLRKEPTEDERSNEGVIYRGKTAWAWWAKAHAYGNMVHGINPVLGVIGQEATVDAARRVVAQRDQALARVGELKASTSVIPDGTTIYLLMVENLLQDGTTESFARDAYATRELADKAKDEAVRRYEARRDKMDAESRHRHTIQTFSIDEITVTAKAGEGGP